MKHSGGALLSSIIIDHTSSKPKNIQIYMEIRDIILSGGLKAGERLPASRTLAEEMSVSRTTVVSAIDRLISEGLVDARSGSGTFVSDVLAKTRPQQVSAEERSDKPQNETAVSAAMMTAIGDFAARDKLPAEPKAFITGLPALEAFPMSQWARLSAKNWRGQRSDVMGYGEPLGLMQLRRAIASHVNASRGIKCDPEQIFITGGAQQAFHLIGSVLLNPRDNVWIENPGAVGARNGFIAAGAHLVPVPIDEEGIAVDEGLRLAPEFKLAFVTPSHQQPLSMVMSLARRFSLLEAAEQAGAWIVEDDYDSEFYFGGQPLPTLKSVDAGGRVIYVGTFSKSLFPALRIGFILSPPGLVTAFEKLFNSFLPGLPTVIQKTVADFMDEGHFATHIRRMRAIYAAKYKTLKEAADLHLDDYLSLQQTQSGLHTVALLSKSLEEAAVVSALKDAGIVVNPLSRYAIAPIKQQGIALGFGAVNPIEIQSGVRRMADVLKAL
ncbi:MAG: PLP-dependent aminotransferase family protein [Sneathiella sp.]|nr:PLP-dependent aminotransferase family protein [Sneathiella sp.]